MTTTEKVLVGAAVVYGAGIVLFLVKYPREQVSNAALWPLTLPALIARGGG